MAKPYEGTVVSVGKSQGEINDMLAQRGITDVRWTATATLRVLEFHHAITERLDDEWCYSAIDCSAPAVGIRRRGGRHFAHKKQRIRAVLGVRIVLAWTSEEKEQRRLMRLMYWMLKSKFEIVDAGLAVFEEEFMPHLTLGQGRRMWDSFAPELERRIKDGMDLSAGIGDSALLAIGAGPTR